MRTESRAIVGSLLLALAACQGATNATEAQEEGSKASSTSEMRQAHPATSQCSSEQVVVLSCKLKKTGNFASLCAMPSADGFWKFRFLYGAPGQPPLATSPSQGMDDGSGFTRSRLMLFGGAGGLVYSTVSEGQRYSLYSIQGKGFSRAGLQISPPGADTAISDEECLQETVVESDNDDVLDAVDRWRSDPTFQDEDLPAVDTQK